MPNNLSASSFSTRKVLHLARQKVIRQIMTVVSCTLCLCRCYELTQWSDPCLPGSDKYAKIELLQKIVIRFGIILIQKGVVADTIQFRISYFFFCKTWCTTATCSQKVLAKNDTLNFSRSGKSELDEVFIRSFDWCQGFAYIHKATKVLGKRVYNADILNFYSKKQKKERCPRVCAIEHFQGLVWLFLLFKSGTIIGWNKVTSTAIDAIFSPPKITLSVT